LVGFATHSAGLARRHRRGSYPRRWLQDGVLEIGDAELQATRRISDENGIKTGLDRTFVGGGDLRVLDLEQDAEAFRTLEAGVVLLEDLLAAAEERQFLVLAAQYESLTLPIAIILIVPMGILAAMTGVWLSKGDNNVFTQIGLIVLVGLSAKNAILIVEFARELYETEGRSLFDAAVVAARMRLRPIIMTSLAFGFGVLPLAIATGAGAGSQNAIGTGVLGGTIAATLLGIFFGPLFYVVIKRIFPDKPREGADAVPVPAAQEGR